MLLLRDQQRHIRLLDIDDLIILCLFLEGYGANTIASFLMLTPPAISHRFNKYRKAFGENFFCKSRNKSYLSETGIKIALKAKEAYCILLGVSTDFVFGSLFQKQP
jgi:hypothetical protein